MQYHICTFTIHNASIKTKQFQGKGNLKLIFTIHNASIKTHVPSESSRH